MAAEAEAAREARAKVGTSSLALYLSLYTVRPSSPCSQKYIIGVPVFWENKQYLLVGYKSYLQKLAV
jgi:hypothetical protein